MCASFLIHPLKIMDKNQKLTRVCLSCGLDKPLAAFLQITGTQGTVYGNICSTCRSNQARTKVNTPQLDEEAAGSSGLKIDSKTRFKMEKIQLELDQKKHQEKLDHTEKRDKQALEKSTSIDIKEKAERYHRKEIETKKQTKFLSDKKQSTPSEKTFIIDQQKPSETAAQEEVLKQSAIDTSQLYLDSQHGELKFQSEIFKRFKDWLGNSANFRTIERLYHRKENQPTGTTEQKDPIIEKIQSSSKRSHK